MYVLGSPRQLSPTFTSALSGSPVLSASQAGPVHHHHHLSFSALPTVDTRDERARETERHTTLWDRCVIEPPIFHFKPPLLLVAPSPEPLPTLSSLWVQPILTYIRSTKRTFTVVSDSRLCCCCRRCQCWLGARGGQSLFHCSTFDSRLIYPLSYATTLDNPFSCC